MHITQDVNLIGSNNPINATRSEMAAAEDEGNSQDPDDDDPLADADAPQDEGVLSQKVRKDDMNVPVSYGIDDQESINHAPQVKSPKHLRFAKMRHGRTHLHFLTVNDVYKGRIPEHNVPYYQVLNLRFTVCIRLRLMFSVCLIEYFCTVCLTHRHNNQQQNKSP